MMKKAFGILGFIMFIVCGGLAFFLELYYAYWTMGLLGVVLGIFIFPVLLVAMPFYALFAFGDLLPLLLSGLAALGQIIAGVCSDKR
jgi:hypothetical protein